MARCVGNAAAALRLGGLRPPAAWPSTFSLDIVRNMPPANTGLQEAEAWYFGGAVVVKWRPQIQS